MDKYKNLAFRVPERVFKGRAGVSEASIRLWFNELYENVKEQNLEVIFRDPTRIFNCDESNIQLKYRNYSS